MNKEKMLDIYGRMVRIRKFEEGAIDFYERSLVKGSLHLYIGEEAVAATVCSFLNDDDYITSTHRGHGHVIAKGADVHGAMAELMGKETGLCKGRGGSMHITDMGVGILGANGIVGGGIPIAMGGALGCKRLGKGQISVAFFGDGASNEGSFHESLNLASLWNLPVIFLCENNYYGMSTPVEQSTPVDDISVRGIGYNMPGVTVDGNDVFAIAKAMEEAVERARSGKGPTLLECKTYRWMGHWYGDPQEYRCKNEIEGWKVKDPIVRFRKQILAQHAVTEEELNAIDEATDKLIKEAGEFAINSPLPDPATVLDYVFVD